MKKRILCVGVCLTLAAFCWVGTFVFHHQRFQEEIIRFHVVANSDSTKDQQIKLQVRNAVLESLSNDIDKIKDPEQARTYIQQKLPYIESVAQKTLTALGCDSTVSVHFSRERFDASVKEEYTLPAGVYHALRIVIGKGQGHNWWGVLFPESCLPGFYQESEMIADVFSQDAGVVEEQTEYELGFWVLDMMERLG